MRAIPESRTAARVENPILPGFYPDPSICRAGEDYYLVNSSFSYFPGVPIFHSRDLVHWRQIGHVLDRPSQLNLTRQPISAGIFAPAIRFHNGVFYMVTTLIGGCGNFFVTARNPAGPWSDPIPLPEINGIDPSFFFDDDGRAYIINNGPPPEDKPLYDGHRAIWLQEFDLQSNRLTGKRQIIINGGVNLADKPIWIEGPHLYRRHGFYYLMAAEGGTSTWHSEVIFRSLSIWGPYEPYIGNPILTQRDLPAERKAPITCVGHVDLVDTPTGEWACVFLACQPYEAGRYYNIGRETFFLPVDWSRDWPMILQHGEVLPMTTRSPAAVSGIGRTFAENSADWRDDFASPALGLEWNFIRTPTQRWYEIKDNKLILQARPVSITEPGNPSFIGRRAQHGRCAFSAAVTLQSDKDLEAGIVAFHNETHLYSLMVVQSENAIRLVVGTARAKKFSVALPDVRAGSKVHLRMEMFNSQLHCAYSLDGRDWSPVGEALDGYELSTEVAGGFVGTYFGLYALGHLPAAATFEAVRYRSLGTEAQVMTQPEGVLTV